MQPFDVATQLLDAVDVAAPLDLDGHDLAVAGSADKIDRADGRRILPAHEYQSDLDGVGTGGEQFLQMGLDAVFLQTRVDAELLTGIREHLVQADDQRFALGVGHRPEVLAGDEGIRGVHPVERLVGPAVGVDGHAAVGLHHDQTDGLG